MADNRITFNIDFKADSTNLNSIKQNLQAIQKATVKDLINPGQFKDAQAELQKIQQMARAVEQTFEATYNQDLGTANLRKFTEYLQSMGYNMTQVQQGFAAFGATGQLVTNQIRGGVAGINFELKKAHPLLDRIATTLGNSIRYTFSTKLINSFVGSIQTAYSYAKNLDESLNNIRIVTGKSSEEMAKFAVQANKAAKALGASTLDYTNASLIYYQQGLGDQEVQARTDVTVKVANITKQSADEVSEQLTAVWNGYRVTAQEAELYIDKLSAVAANSASDLEELSTAMSKVASGAAAMGVDIDELTAQISTIVSVTRQDAANVGTALKTIYARIGDLAVSSDAVDEFGVSLGDVSSKLAIMGVNVLDQRGNLRDLGDIITEVAGKWGTWTEAQQQAAAVALAGKRQYNNLIALFNNWDMYEGALEISKTSEGTLQEQQDTYMESLEAHLDKLRASGEKVYDVLFDNEKFNGLLDFLSALVDEIGMFFESIGGGMGVLTTLGTILFSVFGNKLSGFLTDTINNFKITRNATKQYSAEVAELNRQTQELDKSQKEYNKNLKEGTKSPEELNADKRQLDLQKSQLDSQKRRVNIIRGVRTGRIGVEQGQELLNRNTDLNKKLNTYQGQREKALSILPGLQQKYGLGEETSIPELTELLAKGDQLDGFKEKWQSVEKVVEDLENRIYNIDVQTRALSTINLDVSSIQFDQEALAGISEEDAQRIVELNREMVALSEHQKEAGISATDYEAAQKKLNKVNQEYQALLSKYPASYKKVTAAGKQFRDLLKQGVDLKGVERAKDQILELAGASQKDTEEVNKLYNTFAQTPSPENLEALKKKLEELGMQVTQDKNEFQQLAQGLEGVGESAQNLNKDVQKINPAGWTEKFMSVVTAVMAIISAVQTLQALTEIWADDTKSTGEKVQQTFQSLLGLIIPLTMAAIGLGKAMEGSALKTWISSKLIKAGTDTAAQGFRGLMASILPVLIVMLGFAAIALIIMVIVKAVDAYKEAQVKAQRALEDANKALEAQKAILEETKQAYDDLKESIEDYEKAQDAIDQLTAGTQKWRDAIVEANQQVLDLLNTYPQLAEYISTDASGRMTISEEGKEALLQQQQNAVSTAQRNVNIATVRRNEAQIAATQEKIRNRVGQRWNYGKAYNEYVFSDSIYKDFITSLSAGGRLVNASDEQIREELSAKLDIDDEGLLQELTDSLRDAAAETRANTLANEILNRSIAQSYLEGDEAYESSDYQDALAAETAKIATSEEYTQKYQQEADDLADYKDDELENAYVEEMGGKEAGLTVKDGVVHKLNADGTIGDELDITPEEMRAQIAKARANKAAAEQSEDIAASLQRRGEAIIAAGGSRELATQVLNQAAGVGADVSAMSQQDLKTLTSYASGLEIGDQDKVAIAEINKMFQQEKAVIDAQSPALVTRAVNALNADGKMTLGMQREINEAFNKAFQAGGQKGIDDAQKFLSQYSGEELEKVTDIFNTIDWASRDANSQFVNALDEAGIEIKGFDGAYAEMIENFKKSRSPVNDLISDFASLKNQLQSVKEITDDLEFGSVIDDDQYKELLSYNAALKDYFVLTEDGYKLIGDPEDVKRVANANIYSIEEYKKAIEGAAEQAKNFGDYNLDTSQDRAPDLKAAQALLSGDNKELLAATGVQADSLRNDVAIINAINQGNNAEAARLLGIAESDFDDTVKNNALNAANDRIRDAYTKLSDVMQKAKNGEIAFTDEEQQLLASRAENFDELRKYYDQGIISQKNYQKVHQAMIAEEVSALGISTNAWNKWAKNLGTNSERAQEAVLKNLKAAQALSDIDLLHDIDDEIAEKQDELARASSTRAIEIQQELIDLEEERNQKLKEQEEIRKASYEDMARILNANVNGAIQFGPNGEVVSVNRDKLYNALQDADEETKDMIQSFLDAEEAYEGIVDQIEESRDLIKQIAYEKYTATIELKLETKETEREYYEFLRSLVERGYDQYGDLSKLIQEEALTYFSQVGTGTSTLEVDWTTYANAKKALEGLASDVPIADKNKAEEDMKNARQALMDDINALLDLQDAASEAYISAIDEMNDKFSEQIAKYGNLQDVINHNLTMMQLLFGETQYGANAMYYEQLGATYDAQLRLQREQVAANKQALDELVQTGADVNSEEYKHALEAYQNSISELNATTEAAIQNLFSVYSNAALASVEKIFAGLSDFDKFTQSWNDFNQVNDRYLTQFNATYEIDKLENEIDKSLDGLKGNIAAQKQLNNLKNTELQALREKGKLTQYDIDRANLLYEIELKRIQLQNAQSTATKMKLVRDASGNYSYQFVADDEKIGETQQELSDLENQLANLDMQQSKDKIGEMMELVDQFKQDISAAMSLGDPNERKEALNRVKNQYGTLFTDLGTDLETVMNNLKGLGFAGDALDALFGEGFVDQLSIVNELMDSLADEDKWEQLKENLLGQSDALGESIDSILENAGTSLGDYLTGDSGINAQVSGTIEEMSKDIDGIVKEINEKFTSTFDALAEQIQNVADTIKEAFTFLEDPQAVYDELERKRLEEEARRKAEEEARKRALGPHQSILPGTQRQYYGNTGDSFNWNPNIPGLTDAYLRQANTARSAYGDRFTHSPYPGFSSPNTISNDNSVVINIDTVKSDNVLELVDGIKALSGDAFQRAGINNR